MEEQAFHNFEISNWEFTHLPYPYNQKQKEKKFPKPKKIPELHVL
jgi:hypothetical protein